jgi:hypothetical protein
MRCSRIKNATASLSVSIKSWVNLKLPRVVKAHCVAVDLHIQVTVPYAVGPGSGRTLPSISGTALAVKEQNLVGAVMFPRMPQTSAWYVCYANSVECATAHHLAWHKQL